MSQTELSTGAVIADRYELVALIGEGGTGSVWRAHDHALGRDVAVKRLRTGIDDEVARDRFRREAIAAASLEHPALVTVYDVGRHDGHMYLVMELVDGRSLDGLLSAGPLSADEVTALGAAVAAALGAAHEAGLVHRDVKPANVLLTRHGHAKLADFGIAKASGAAETALTAPGTLIGTASYLAPEQVAGAPVDSRTDVYALGLVLHECLTGRRVFGTGTLAEIASRRLADDVPPVSGTVDIPGALDQIITRATRRDPAERYADGRALAAALAPLAPPDGDRRLRALVAARSDVPAQQDTAVITAPTTRAHRAAAPTTPSAVPAEPTAAVPPVPPAANARVPKDGGSDPTATIGMDTARADIDEDVGEPDEPANGTPTWQPIAVALGLLAGLVGLAVALGGSDDTSSSADGSDKTPFAIVSADDLDPPPGDGEEHAEEVSLAHDGDTATAWRTEGYERPDLGGLKPGVGLVFDLGEPRPVNAVVLELGLTGADLEIYAVDGEVPQDSGAWGEPVAAVTDAPTTTAVEIDGEVTARRWIVWFTRLGADGGDYRASIEEVALLPE